MLGEKHCGGNAQQYIQSLLLIYRRAFPALSRPSQGIPVPKPNNNTYTATFCCLGRNSKFGPSTKEQYALSCNGLGKKRHSLDKDGSHQYVQAEKISSWKKFSQGQRQLVENFNCIVQLVVEMASNLSIKLQWIHMAIQLSGSVMTWLWEWHACMWYHLLSFQMTTVF